jgi:hypothetical protein
MEQMLEIGQRVDLMHLDKKLEDAVITGRAFDYPEKATYNILTKDRPGYLGKSIKSCPAENLRPHEE